MLKISEIFLPAVLFFFYCWTCILEGTVSLEYFVRPKFSYSTSNNYPPNWTNPHTRCRLKKKPHRPTPFTFNIPYIDDRINANVKHILTKHNIPARLTNSRGLTVRQLARRPTYNLSTCQSKACPAPEICQRSSVIYKATCKICDLFYVGLTKITRPCPWACNHRSRVLSILRSGRELTAISSLRWRRNQDCAETLLRVLIKQMAA